MKTLSKCEFIRIEQVLPEFQTSYPQQKCSFQATRVKTNLVSLNATHFYVQIIISRLLLSTKSDLTSTNILFLLTFSFTYISKYKAVINLYLMNFSFTSFLQIFFTSYWTNLYFFMSTVLNDT